MLKGKKVSSATLEKAFGRVLSTRRESTGMSQVDLALASGYGLRYIGDVGAWNEERHHPYVE